MSEMKRVNRFYTPDMYDKEEKFLTEMSLTGWHFVHFTPPCSYLFEKGQPKPYVYKLDFRRRYDDDLDNYKAIYEDCGWDHLQEFRVFKGAWEYFRKECVYGSENDIFTDNESKIDLLIKIRRFYLFLGIFFIGINIPNFINLIYRLMENGFFLITIIYSLLFGIVFGLYLRIFIGVSMKINKLKGN